MLKKLFWFYEIPNLKGLKIFEVCFYREIKINLYHTYYTANNFYATNINFHKIYHNMFKLVLALFVIICSCNRPTSKIKNTLMLAGENKKELEQVVNHYKHPKDSLKLKATNYLIENMSNKRFKSGNTFEIRDKIFSQIETLEHKTPLRGNYNFPKVDSLWNRISETEDPFNVSRSTYKYDRDIITAKLLIENIEYAFKAWRMPWAEHVTFEEFCEYILPYRSTDEKLESWRPFFYNKYKWVLDSIKNPSDPVEACAIVNNDLKKWFRFSETFKKYKRAIGPTHLWQGKMGICRDQNSLAIFAMRSIGIPVAHESIPLWGHRDIGHDFSSVLSKKGKFIDFIGAELQPTENGIGNIPPKIYRQTYQNQLENFPINKNKLPLLFQNTDFIDVTKEYVPVVNISIKLISPLKNTKTLYLGVFNNNSWKVISWTEIKKDATAEFKNMGRNCAYLPMYFINNQYIPAHEPIIADSLGTIKKIACSLKKIQNLELKRKYPLTKLKIWWKSLMVNGRFQGANKSDFSDAENIFTIKKPIDLAEHKITLKKQKRYQFLRYLFPNDTYGSLGEIGFYSSKNKRINGLFIKSNAVSEKDLNIAFDEKFNKFIHTKEKGDYNEQWIGLKLDKSQNLSHISFCPRTDENNIIPEMIYELFYWNNKWISLGKQKADSNKLMYKAMPTNALFILRNLSTGKEERIFTYNKGKQIWW